MLYSNNYVIFCAFKFESLFEGFAHIIKYQ